MPAASHGFGITAIPSCSNKCSPSELVDEEPDTFTEVWQTGKYLIGMRFALARVGVEKLRHIAEMAWRTKAPNKLVNKNA